MWSVHTNTHLELIKHHHYLIDPFHLNCYFWCTKAKTYFYPNLMCIRKREIKCENVGKVTMGLAFEMVCKVFYGYVPTMLRMSEKLFFLNLYFGVTPTDTIDRFNTPKEW